MSKQQTLQNLAEAKSWLLEWVKESPKHKRYLPMINSISELQKVLAPQPEELEEELENKLFGNDENS